MSDDDTVRIETELCNVTFFLK